jgi:hypothetical protein
MQDASSDPLYLSDAKIRRKLGISEERWPGVLAAFERQGFPSPDPVTAKRFWPQVLQWLFLRHGIGGSIGARIEDDADGEEHWPHREQRRRRVG